MKFQILHKQGKSLKAIARETGYSINTIRKYIRGGTCEGYKKRTEKPSILDPFRHYVLQRISQATPHWLPATVILRELQSLGYSGKISLLRNYMKTLKPVIIEEAATRFETAPGEQMQVDWAECRRRPTRLAAFIATLGYSRSSYVEFVENEKLETLEQCHENAFHFFGGVTEDVLYDNMRTIVIERNAYGKGHHRIQSGFWDFAKH